MRTEEQLTSDVAESIASLVWSPRLIDGDAVDTLGVQHEPNPQTPQRLGQTRSGPLPILKTSAREYHILASDKRNILFFFFS